MVRQNSPISRKNSLSSSGLSRLIFLLLAIVCSPSFGVAQDQQGQQQKPGQQQAPAEAGGPQGDIGPIAIPKKKEEEPKKEEAPKSPKKVEGLDNFSMRVASQ